MSHSVTCIKCNYESNNSLLVYFKFNTRKDKPVYDYMYDSHTGPMPKDRHTIQDDTIVCNKCCGFSVDKPRPRDQMEMHWYTWHDGTESYCSHGHFVSRKHDKWVIKSIKELRREVKRLRNEQRKDAVSKRARRALYQGDA